jgi:hypothetical protein
VSGKAQGGDDLVLAKFSADGAKQWIKRYGSSKSETLSDLALGEDGSLYAVGSGYGSGGGVSGKNQGRLDFIVARFSPSGAKQWIKTSGGSNADEFSSLAMASDGAFYAVGNTNSGTPSLDLSSGGWVGWFVCVPGWCVVGA